MLRTHHRLALLLLLGGTGVGLSAQAPANATAKCKDGTYSTSTSSKGRCSNHGGVAELIKPAPASATTPPAGATFECKDGTYSKAKSAQGACSKHGGVDHALSSAAASAPSAAAPAPATGAAPSGATFQCKDGTYSKAKSAQGACSKHGGVDHALAGAAAPTNEAAPAAEREEPSSGKAPTVARPAGAPAAATAKCKDGTYSESKQHSGACSHHGGVAEWYQ